MPPLHDLACVVHVHSTFSDGRATVDEIATAARSSGADAVLLTDHDTLEAKRRGLEGWRHGVLVLVGVEVSPRGGHFLAFGLDDEIDHRGMSEGDIAAAVARAGALGFAAHPFSRGSRMSRRIGRPHPWQALDRDDYTGIELWSLVTEAAEAWSSPREALSFMRDPERQIDGPPRRNLAQWDRLCARRRTVGIGGLDAHQSGLRIGDRVLSPFPNERYFGYLRTHVLCHRPPSGRLEEDRREVYGALAEGRCYLAADALAPASGFRFWAHGSQGRVEMGGEGPGGEHVLHARLPRPAELTLLRDGKPVRRLADADGLVQQVEGNGVYRLEARLRRRGRWRMWLISNPLYLREPDGGAAAAGSA